jgi:beta-phosphoglucomutase-like phosphatase (HAD superfamily)
VTIAILDIDGTLVDTNYQHALAWYRAFRQHDIVLPVWRIHRHIGMGGDQLVEALTDEQTEKKIGDDIRSAESALYLSLIEEVEPFEGARDLVVAVRDRGHSPVLASSAKEQEVDHYLDLLDAREIADSWTSSGDVEETKPAPDLVQTALKKAGAGEDEDAPDAVMIGDTPWDIIAAEKAGVKTLAVLSGGFGEDELREAGAVEVYTSIGQLLEKIDDSPLAKSGYRTGASRGLGRSSRPALACGSPSTITTSAVKSLPPRSRLDPTPYASTGAAASSKRVILSLSNPPETTIRTR